MVLNYVLLFQAVFLCLKNLLYATLIISVLCLVEPWKTFQHKRSEWFCNPKYTKTSLRTSLVRIRYYGSA